MSDRFRVDIQEIFKKNPRVDIDRLEESENLQRSLKRAGYVKKGYGLAEPFERVRRSGVEQQNDHVTQRRSTVEGF